MIDAAELSASPNRSLSPVGPAFVVRFPTVVAPAENPDNIRIANLATALARLTEVLERSFQDHPDLEAGLREVAAMLDEGREVRKAEAEQELIEYFGDAATVSAEQADEIRRQWRE